MIYAVDTHEDERRSQRVRERVDAVAERERELSVLRCCGWIDPVARPRLEQQGLDARIVRRCRVPRRLARADRVEREVDGNPVEPGKRLAPAVEAIEGLIRPYEGLLCHVLRLRARSNEVERQAKNALLMAADKEPECLCIPVPGLVHELAISGI